MEQDNPYTALISLFGSRSAQSAAWVTGKVISASPLRIRVQEVDLDMDDLYICEFSSGVTADAALSAGDTVLLLPDPEMQLFVLVAKLTGV